MRYLKAEDILALHKDIIDQTGGSHGIRDIGLFSSIVERPRGQAFGQELYPDLWSKVAAYLHSIAMNHVFVDGNKRTSIVSASYFIHLNGYELMASNEEVERFVLSVVVDKLDVASIAEWFKLHAKNRKR